MTPRSRKPSPPDQTVTIGSHSWEALWEQTTPPPPEILKAEDGWRTASDEARRLGINHTSADTRLRALAARGILECRLGRGPRNIPTKFFRPKITKTEKSARAKR